MKLPSVHRTVELRGSARACGREYGQQMAEAITGFVLQDASMGSSLAACCAGVPPDEQHLAYARDCIEVLRCWDKKVAEFAAGMAEGSGRPLEEVVMLLLHEEIGHTKYCTALGATGAGTTDGAPVIGQNWDGLSMLYPWSHLTRYSSDDAPSALFYSYPGLWSATGMNEFGLGLVWTSAGIYPLVRPVVGVPTYALIAGILAQETCHEALKLLERTPIAGCFIFFLADAKGEVWVVEGIPGRFEAERCVDVIGRANHYNCRAMCEASAQKVPETSLAANSAPRGQRIVELLDQYRGQIDRATVELMLSDHGVKPGFDICQHPVPGRDRLTLDSMYMLPQKREVWIARGSPCRRSYTSYTV